MQGDFFANAKEIFDECRNDLHDIHFFGSITLSAKRPFYGLFGVAGAVEFTVFPEVRLNSKNNSS